MEQYPLITQLEQRITQRERELYKKSYAKVQWAEMEKDQQAFYRIYERIVTPPLTRNPLLLLCSL